MNTFVRLASCIFVGVLMTTGGLLILGILLTNLQLI